MCYHILNQKGNVIARSSVQRVTKLDLQTTEYKELFESYDDSIKDKLKCKDRSYDGAKSHSKDLADLLAFNSSFNDEYNRVFDNKDIPETDDHTPEVLEYTYFNMELTIFRDSGGPKFTRVTKTLRDADGLPIGAANDIPLLDTRLYEVAYGDGHEVSLAANKIAINVFDKVYEEGNRYVLFDEIIDHHTYGSEVQEEDAFITASDDSRRRHETTKYWEI